MENDDQMRQAETSIRTELTKYFASDDTANILKIPGIELAQPKSAYPFDLSCKGYVIVTDLEPLTTEQAQKLTPEEQQKLRYAYDEPALWQQSMAEHYEEVKEPKLGDIVAYFTGNHPEPTHVGFYRGNGMVESKWGLHLDVFKHPLKSIPENYGNIIKYMRKKKN
jgi:hypothetical protein